MTGGPYRTPVLRVPAPVSVPVVRVPVPNMPAVVRSQALGPIGPAGGKGDPGPPGSKGSLGQITYTDRVSGPEDRYEANIRQQVRLAPGSTTVLDKLLPPFVGHVFVHDDRFWPLAMDDAYDIHVNLIVMADQAGTKIKMDCDAGSVLGPLQADDKTLFEPAGASERVTFNFSIQTLANTLANGAAFFLRATKPITILSEAVYVVPQSIQPTSYP